jgi:hypothetical protein
MYLEVDKMWINRVYIKIIQKIIIMNTVKLNSVAISDKIHHNLV